MSVWNAIMDSDADAESARARAALMRAIRERIDALGWSTTTAATMLGVSRSRVDDLLRGRLSTFDLDTLAAVAHRMDEHITDLDRKHHPVIDRPR